MTDKEQTQALVNTLITDKGMAESHVVSALSSDVPLNIGIALTELKEVFGERDLLVVTDELAYTANDLVASSAGYSVDGASRFYYQLMLSDKAALVKAINAVLMLESKV